MDSRQIKVSFNDKRIPGDVTLILSKTQYRILYLMNKNNEIDIFDLCCYFDTPQTWETSGVEVKCTNYRSVNTLNFASVYGYQRTMHFIPDIKCKYQKYIKV